MGLELASEYPWLTEDGRGKIVFERDGEEYIWFPEGETCRIARIRRGKWVPIPAEWRGKTVDGSSIRKRPSKMVKKRARRMKNHAGERYKGEKSAPSE